MRQKKPLNLSDVISDISRTMLNPEFDMNSEEPRPPIKAAPNRWRDVKAKPEHYGGSYDFETYDHGDTVVIYPACVAAREWLYAHLPEGTPRWQVHGHVIEKQYINKVLIGMRRDGLISEDEFVLSMELDEQLNQMNQQSQDDA